ncbi:MBL fold metallo-hydrolase, partial [Klenkia sp. PcliD-1-E]|uniref:MBL fold metallo-hydrolase n=1 Tax=Klenkia sp. PcliD-1-E TaxID=2954492 RepID=UPI002096ADC0
AVSAAFTATAPAASAAPPRPAGDQVVMLGTGGGPVINPDAARPASALVVGGAVYLVDCGADTPQQLVAAGLTFNQVSNVFLTHQHLDHTSGLPTLAAHGWVAQPHIPSVVDVWGPPPMSTLTEGIPATYAEGIELFSIGNAFGPFPDLRPHDVVAAPGAAPVRVLEDANVVVDAVWVQHTIPYAYAYRFTLKSSGKVVVFSGDVVANEPNLIALARGCDVLVHEALDPDRVEDIVANLPEPARSVLRGRITGGHTSVYDVPGVAKAAGAKKLVLNHYTPVPQRPSDWLRKARQAARQVGYTGEVVAPGDLDVVRVPQTPARAARVHTCSSSSWARARSRW